MVFWDIYQSQGKTENRYESLQENDWVWSRGHVNNYTDQKTLLKGGSLKMDIFFSGKVGFAKWTIRKTALND